MKKQGPTAALSNAPGWLLISGFVLGNAVPAAVGGTLLVYFASQLTEVRTPAAIAGVVLFCLVFGTATFGALAVGVSAIVCRNVEAARFLALLTGVAAILTGIGVAYDYSITRGWTWKQIMVATLIVYYLFTSCVVYARLSVVLAKDEGSDLNHLRAVPRETTPVGQSKRFHVKRTATALGTLPAAQLQSASEP